MVHTKLKLRSFESEGNPPIDLTKRGHKSNESCGVWVSNGEAWKIFSSTDKMQKIKNTYESAKGKGLPMPKHRFVSGRVTCSNSPDRAGFALVTTLLSGYSLEFVFDQKVGRGHRRAFLDYIDRITDDAILYKIECGLHVAETVGLKDPQGFFEPTSRDCPLMFIDIHTNPPASVSIIDLRKAVLKRRALLNQK